MQAKPMYLSLYYCCVQMQKIQERGHQRKTNELQRVATKIHSRKTGELKVGHRQNNPL
jgi:hypothetical protein